MRAAGWPAERRRFATRCDNQSTYWQLVRAGCGIGFAVTAAGRADPLVEEVDLGLGAEIPALPEILAEELANPAAFL